MPPWYNTRVDGVLRSSLRAGWAAAKANMLPMLVLWSSAVLTIACYCTFPGFAAMFEPIAALQREYGWMTAFANRMVFTGLIPGMFLLAMRSIRPRHPFAVVVAQSLWCGMWGVICDKLYVFMDWMFGDGTDVLSVAMKTLFTVGSLLPAVGVAILCKQVVQKPLAWVTFGLGFTLAAVIGFNLIASALIAVFFALINFKIEQLKLARPAVAAAGAAFDDEEEEDI